MANTHIPLFYRLFFLYIDPLFNLSGIYVSFLDHTAYLSMGVPRSLTTTPTPITEYLIMALGSWSLSILVIQTLLLQQYRDVKLWKIVMFGILLTDFGLVYGLYAANPTGIWQVGKWMQGEWISHGIFATVIPIRMAFLAGVGMV